MAATASGVAHPPQQVADLRFLRSRWARTRRGASVKNAFSYSLSGTKAAAMEVAISSLRISSGKDQYGTGRPAD